MIIFSVGNPNSLSEYTLSLRFFNFSCAVRGLDFCSFGGGRFARLAFDGFLLNVGFEGPLVERDPFEEGFPPALGLTGAILMMLVN